MTPAPRELPVLAVTLGDPRGIGPEVALGALGAGGLRDRAAFRIFGPEAFRSAFEALRPGSPDLEYLPVGPTATGSEPGAGRAAAEAIEAGIALVLAGEADGLVTAPISKRALHSAGYRFPGHTELLRERTGVPDVTMVMAAEQTPLGGPLRIALVTVHVPLREVPGLLTVERVAGRAAIAAAGLRDWWGIPRPRLAFAGVNPHASEGGLFGDEEERVIRPAMARLEREEGLDVSGPFPADSVFRRCLAGEADLVVVPYHDAGLAVLKTLAPEHGINVTTGLPFPRTSPDHGTAFDIAGTGRADPRSMAAAIESCIDFCGRVRAGSGTA